MKQKTLLVIGFTLILVPGLALAQNAVTEWNNIAVKTAVLGNLAIPPNSPNGMALYLAYVHLAMHDAVNAIQHRYQPYGPPLPAPAGASVEAAVAAAAYTTLQFHFPDQSATLTATYNGWLAALPDSGKADGIAAGASAANQILTVRAGNGQGADVPYTYPSVPTPGIWIPTPLAFAPPITPWMGQMMPFTMRSASQFFPEPPLSLASTAWADDYNQVKTLVLSTAACEPRSKRRSLFFGPRIPPCSMRARCATWPGPTPWT